MGTEEPLSLVSEDMLFARSAVQATFIHLSNSFVVTSAPTEDYNCVSWAAGDTENYWWPYDGYYWPSGIVRALSIASFIEAFQTLSYDVCENGSLEAGFEKIVLYTKNGRPTHMARQFATGNWTSKLGHSYDIAFHDLEGLAGNLGRIELFMCRLRVLERH